MRIHTVRLLLVGAVASTALLAWGQPVAAHEERGVGNFQFVVGWGDEPTYTGYKNSVSVAITENGKPVNDVGEDLQVEVTYGDASSTLQLEPNFVPGVFGEEGDYRAWMTPTEAGEYSFRIFGTHDGQKINETFTSGAKTFAEPIDAQEIQFPTKEPSTAELGQRVDRQLARVQAQADGVASLPSDVDALRSDLDQARFISIAASVVAALAMAGLIGIALARRRSPVEPAAGRVT